MSSENDALNEPEGFFQLTNYKDHPTNNLYKVYFFHQKNRAEHFAKLLKERNIFFERGEEEQAISGKLFYLFGVRKSDLDVAHECNFLTNAHFREPFLGKNRWKYLISIFVVAIVILAIVSAVMNG